MHRFVWDLRHAEPEVLEHEVPISAVPGDTPRGPLGPAVLPGTYTVRLTVGARTLTAPLTVKMDPRVTTPAAGLAEKYRIATALADAIHRDFVALSEVRAARAKLAEKMKSGKTDALTSLDADLASLEGASGGRRRGSAESLAGLNGKLAGLYAVVEGSESAPTTQAVAAWGELDEALGKALDRWKELKPRAPAS
jgi:hypothetical protein